MLVDTIIVECEDTRRHTSVCFDLLLNKVLRVVIGHGWMSFFQVFTKYLLSDRYLNFNCSNVPRYYLFNSDTISV